MEDLVGNVLVVQLGCTSPVSNAALGGVISGALNYENIEEIFGSPNGFHGILSDTLIDLAVQSQQSIRDLSFTPGAALGTRDWSGHSPEAIASLFSAFQKHNIRFLFIIGGTDAQSVALELTQFAQSNGHEIKIISIPDASDNSLPITDHCLGYGSVAKFIATAVREITTCVSSIAHHDRVNIIEVSGKDSSWVVPSALLAKMRDGKGRAHIVLLPSQSFSENIFLSQVQAILQSNDCCTIVTGESLINEEGNYITGKMISASTKLQSILEESLDIQVVVTKLGTLQFAAASCLSKTDVDEAWECGSKAVDFALDGISGKMMTLLRADGVRYCVEYGVADLANIVGHKKSFPEHWFDENGTLNGNFVKYAQPLIQGNVGLNDDNGLPRFSILKNDHAR